jgi:hypothetical protein
MLDTKVGQQARTIRPTKPDRPFDAMMRGDGDVVSGWRTRRAFAADGHHYKEDKDADKDTPQEVILKHSDRTQEERFSADERRDQNPEEDGRQSHGRRCRGRGPSDHTAARGSRGNE